ncbi:MAG TPA: SAM-dependent methyltransferase [Acidimicrobiales bacterium]|nr:SAM-dependent methyltransferase [Acidimicrobiales bacterium]
MTLVLTHHPRFRRAALAEAEAAFGALTEVERPDRSVTVIDCPSEDQGLIRDSIFVQHVAPGDRAIRIEGTSGDVGMLVDATASMAAVIRGKFAVQCRRGAHSGGAAHSGAAYTTRDVEIAIGAPIEQAGASVELDQPEQVLSIYLGGSTAYAGVSPAALNKRILIPQHRRYAATPEICRAEHKLEEAIDLWQLRSDLMGADVLDVGASPGGWSWVLARAGARVTAVDPGDLDPRVTALDGVEHLKARAESLSYDGAQFDWVVNDMNVDPPLAAEVLVQVHPWLRGNARGVTTLKLAGRSRPREVLGEFVSRLTPHYETEAAQHLYSNRQEVTLLLRRA